MPRWRRSSAAAAPTASCSSSSSPRSWPMTPTAANDATGGSGARAPLGPVRIGLVSISDRASTGVYEDKGVPALQAWLGRALRNPIEWETRLIPDEQALIS